MKKSTKIILTILTIIIIISSAVVLWQYDNISAVLNGLTKSSEDIASEINRKREDLKVKVEKYTNSLINDLTAEDEQKLLKGEMSLDEIAKKYDLPIEYINDENNEQEDFSPTKDVSESQQSNFGKSSDDVTVDNSKIIEKEIGDSVSRMYALKAKYVNKLGELEREVIDQYSKLPKEKQNTEGKKELVTANIDYVASLEKTCDTEVDNVISTLEKTLNDLGGDVEIINILKNAYADEKELRKSYYLSLYNE